MPAALGKKKVMKCSKCDYTSEDMSSAQRKETVKKEEVEIEAVDPEDYQILPLTEAECPKCGHRKAYYWLIQTRAGDEAETKFLKCEKCKHIWRDYS